MSAPVNLCCLCASTWDLNRPGDRIRAPAPALEQTVARRSASVRIESYKHTDPSYFMMDPRRRIGLPLVCPTHYEPYSPDFLARSVQDRRDDVEILERLTQESCSLQWRILLYRRHSCLAMDILEASYGALLRLQNALEKPGTDGVTGHTQCRQDGWI